MKKVTNDSVIFAYKKAGVPSAVVAKKLNLTAEEVDARYQAICAELAAPGHQGYQNMIDHFTVMTHQYQLLGLSLRLMAEMIQKSVPASEVLKVLTGDPEKDAAAVVQFFVVLPLPDPVNLEEELKKSVSSN